MQNANVNLFKIINYIKYVKIEMIEISVFIILFMKNNYDNNFFLNYF